MAETDNDKLKSQLNQLITDKNSEITSCNTIKQKLETEKGNLLKYKKEWNTQYKKHSNLKITNQVVIDGVFEGSSAKKLKGYYGTQVDNMQDSSNKTKNLCDKLENQISKLEKHIASLNEDVKQTQTKLSNLED